MWGSVPPLIPRGLAGSLGGVGTRMLRLLLLLLLRVGGVGFGVDDAAKPVPTGGASAHVS